MATSKTQADAKASADPTAIVKRYFDAIAQRDLDGMVAVWAPGGIEDIRGQIKTTAPDGVREFFGELFAAVPDFELRVLDYTAQDDRVVARWEAHGTFSGTTPFKGITPNGAKIALEGCDVLVVKDGLIVRNDAYSDSMKFARDIGMMPPEASGIERAMFGAFNLKTRAAAAVRDRR